MAIRSGLFDVDPRALGRLRHVRGARYSFVRLVSPGTPPRPARAVPSTQAEFARQVLGNLPRKSLNPISLAQDKMVKMGMGDNDISQGLSDLVGSYSDIKTSAQLRAKVAELFPGDKIKQLPWYVRIGLRFKPLFDLAVTLIADRFVIAPDLSKGSRAVAKLERTGLFAVMDLVGESAATEEEANTKFDDYMCALRNIDHFGLKHKNLSLKLTALTTDFHDLAQRQVLKGKMMQMLEEAHQRNVRITIDMEQFEYKNETIAFYKDLLETRSEYAENLELVLQAYLIETAVDAVDLVTWGASRGTKVNIRLVKGAYSRSEKEKAAEEGYADPICADQDATDANYDEVARLLLNYQRAGRARVSLASHNLRTLANALSYAKQIGINNEDLEVQMLYGMATVPILYALNKMGYRVVVYTPIGEKISAIEYLARRMDENKNLNSCLGKFQKYLDGKVNLEDYLTDIFGLSRISVEA